MYFQSILTHTVWETHNDVIVYGTVNSLIGYHGFNSNLSPKQHNTLRNTITAHSKFTLAYTLANLYSFILYNNYKLLQVKLNQERYRSRTLGQRLLPNKKP